MSAAANSLLPVDWRLGLLPATAVVQDAIRSLNQSALQIVLVVEDDDVLVGTITDGDIRRGLLRGLTLGGPVAAILERNALVVTPHVPRELVLDIMKANRVHQVPVVDDSHRIVGLHLWDALVATGDRPNLIVIMAGGAGARMRPHTNACPKPMLLLNGKPMLEHIIVRCRAEGFTRFVIAIHYLGHIVEEYFGCGDDWGAEIEYIREKQPLGTAGALSLLATRPSDPFVVSNGDIITDIRYSDLVDFHSRHDAAATMAVRLHEWQHPYGVVHTDGLDIVGFEEKPVNSAHVNAGMYVLDPSALDILTKGEACHMPTLFERLKQRGARTIAYPMHEPWLDIGRPQEYEQANGRARTDN